MPRADRSEKWIHPDGKQTLGYVHPTTGKYVIFKRVGSRANNKLYEKSTDQTDLIRAAVQFERFMKDPENYVPPDEERNASVSKSLGIPVEPPKPKFAPIYLTPELIEEHMAWAKREGKIKSRLWPMHKRAHLRWWLKTSTA